MKAGQLFMITVVTVMALFAANAEVVFWDTFTTPGNISSWNEINTDNTPGNAGFPDRQSGGLVTSTYTVNTAGGGRILVGDSASWSVQSNEPLLMQAQGVVGEGKEISVDLDTDFGSHLAGKTWVLSYSGLIASSVSYSGWTGFSVGNPATTPNGTDSGVGFITSATGGWQIFAGGTLVGSGSLGRSTVGLYYISAVINEATGMFSMTYQDDTGTVDLGSYSSDFSDSSRYVELKNRASSVTANGNVDWRIDDLKIETVPEPATVGLLGLSGLAVMFVRRYTARM